MVVKEGESEVLVYFDSASRSRLIIPKVLRNRVKQILHADHRWDLTRVKARAQEHVYWPTMAGDLKSFVEQCLFCQVNMTSHPKEPLVPTEVPSYPFQMVAADYFEVKSHSYLVYVDRYTGWNRTAHFPPGKRASAELIKVLRQEFGSMGVPEELSCDGGKNLTSSEVIDWLKSWGVKMRVSSAHYPQSNGRAECALTAAKALVMGNTTPTGSINTDKYLRATLAYRNSAIYPETGKTVAQSLLGRNLRDCLPAVRGFYNLKKEHLMERKQRELVAAKRVKVMVDTYNKGARHLPPLEVGDKVRIQNQTTTRATKWDRTGVITATLDNRKYEIMMDGSRRITT